MDRIPPPKKAITRRTNTPVYALLAACVMHFFMLFAMLPTLAVAVDVAIAFWCQRGDDADGPINPSEKDVIPNVY